MEAKFFYHHHHPGFSKELIEAQLLNRNLCDGFHKVILKNDHLEKCTCVKISMFDSRVFWAYRGTRKYPSPMITQKDAEAIGMELTDDITVILKKKGDTYRIITCYAGSGSPKEPSTAKASEYEECVKYWSNHALVPDENIRRATTLEEMPEWVVSAYLMKSEKKN